MKKKILIFSIAGALLLLIAAGIVLFFVNKKHPIFPGKEESTDESEIEVEQLPEQEDGEFVGNLPYKVEYYELDGKSYFRICDENKEGFTLSYDSADFTVEEDVVSQEGMNYVVKATPNKSFVATMTSFYYQYEITIDADENGFISIPDVKCTVLEELPTREETVVDDAEFKPYIVPSGYDVMDKSVSGTVLEDESVFVDTLSLVLAKGEEREILFVYRYPYEEVKEKELSVIMASQGVVTEEGETVEEAQEASEEVSTRDISYEEISVNEKPVFIEREAPFAYYYVGNGDKTYLYILTDGDEEKANLMLSELTKE